jgi:hypothetical protein
MIEKTSCFLAQSHIGALLRHHSISLDSLHVLLPVHVYVHIFSLFPIAVHFFVFSLCFAFQFLVSSMSLVSYHLSPCVFLGLGPPIYVSIFLSILSIFFYIALYTFCNLLHLSDFLSLHTTIAALQTLLTQRPLNSVLFGVASPWKILRFFWFFLMSAEEVWTVICTFEYHAIRH